MSNYWIRRRARRQAILLRLWLVSILVPELQEHFGEALVGGDISSGRICTKIIRGEGRLFLWTYPWEAVIDHPDTEVVTAFDVDSGEVTLVPFKQFMRS